MKIGIFILMLAYGLSQFYRAVLAVLVPVLQSDIGAKPEDLATASGVWFVAFALMQIPVGAALDKIGPRRTTAILFTLGGAGGAALFAMATAPWHVTLAMMMIGIGCSPVLMASYFIFARMYPAAVFATLAAMTIGLGSLGNIASSAPMAWAVETFGWRAALWSLSALTLLSAMSVAVFVKDPPIVSGPNKGSFRDVFRIKALWPVFAIILVNYIPAASIRGLWAGPYLQEVFAADAATIGRITLVMSIAMVIGNLSYGPMDRLFGSRKTPALIGNGICVAACFALAIFVDVSLLTVMILMALIGFFGSSFALVMAHGKSFIPAHLAGRGVTILNMFSIGGAGLMQFATRPLVEIAFSTGATPAQVYSFLFMMFGGVMLLGLVIYLRAQDTAG